MHKNKEATTKTEIVDYEKFSMEASPETQTLVTMCNTVTAKFNNADKYDDSFDQGWDYDWSKQHIKVSINIGIVLI